MPQAIARGSCAIPLLFGCVALWLTDRCKCGPAAASVPGSVEGDAEECEPGLGARAERRRADENPRGIAGAPLCIRFSLRICRRRNGPAAGIRVKTPEPKWGRSGKLLSKKYFY